MDVLDLEVINSYLTTAWVGRAAGWANELWPTLNSTNTRAAELAALGAPGGVLVLSRQQTAGRGRQGRTWISPIDSGVYASFLLRPSGQLASLPLYTLATGVACVKAIYECTGISLGLKWVNDLVYGGGKVGGILAEIPSTTGSAQSPDAGKNDRALVIGIGINLYLEESDIPEDLRPRINWLERITNQPADPNLLVASLAKNLELVAAQLENGQQQDIINQWKVYSVTVGRQIQATLSGEAIKGLAIDLAADGALVVETEGREKILLSGGEITIRNVDGTYI